MTVLKITFMVFIFLIAIPSMLGIKCFVGKESQANIKALDCANLNGVNTGAVSCRKIIGKGCLQKKKVHMEGNWSSLFYPLPPLGR